MQQRPGTGAPSAARPHPAPVKTPTGSHRDPSDPARAHVRNGRGLDRCPTPPSPTTPWGLLTTNVQTTKPRFGGDPTCQLCI